MNHTHTTQVVSAEQPYLVGLVCQTSRFILLFLLLCLFIQAPARTVYVFDDTAFQGEVTGIEFETALQIGGYTEIWSTNNWAPAASNYLGGFASYAASSLVITSTVADNLSPPPTFEVYASVDGLTWFNEPTNVAVLLSISGGLTAANYAVSNMVIYAFANPESAFSTTDARGQTVLVDTPIAGDDDDQIATKRYVDERQASLWSGYAAASKVQLDENLLDFGNGFRMVSYETTNWQFRVGGVPLITVSADIGSGTNLTLTNWVSTNNTFKFTIEDAGTALISVETSTDGDDWSLADVVSYATNGLDITVTVTNIGDTNVMHWYRVAATEGTSFTSLRFDQPFTRLDLAATNGVIGSISNRVVAGVPALSFYNSGTLLFTMGTNSLGVSGNVPFFISAADTNTFSGDVAIGDTLSVVDQINLGATALVPPTGTAITLWNSNGTLYAVGATWTNKLAP